MIKIIGFFNLVKYPKVLIVYLYLLDFQGQIKDIFYFLKKNYHEKLVFNKNKTKKSLKSPKYGFKTHLFKNILLNNTFLDFFNQSFFFLAF